MRSGLIIGILTLACAAPVLAQDLPVDTRIFGQGVLSQAEADRFRVTVGDCWAVAGTVPVTIGFALDPDGRVAAAIRLVSPGVDGPGVQDAYDAARRAVIRCQEDGYDLPSDKYADWQEVELTFDPSGTLLR